MEETINLMGVEKKRFSKFCFLVVVFTDFLMIFVLLPIFYGAKDPILTIPGKQAAVNFHQLYP